MGKARSRFNYRSRTVVHSFSRSASPYTRKEVSKVRRTGLTTLGSPKGIKMQAVWRKAVPYSPGWRRAAPARALTR